MFNIVTGLTFSIPMAVQPMKAIAAVALTEGLTAAQICAAGATVSLIVLVLGLTGLVDWLNRVIPKPVVRGLQLALGLSLLMKGLQMIAQTHTWVGADSYLTGCVAAAIVVAFAFSTRMPAALVLFVAGLGLAIWKQPDVLMSVGVHVTLAGMVAAGAGGLPERLPESRAAADSADDIELGDRGVRVIGGPVPGAPRRRRAGSPFPSAR